MATDTRAQSNGVGYTGRPVTKAPAWHGLVAWDMLFNNLTTGLFMAAALGELFAPAVFTPVARAAYPLALILLLADLICLVLDLGDPLRFHHMLRVFKPTSPMSLGTWCLTIYALPLTVAAALSLLPPPEADATGLAVEWVRKAAVVLGLLPALGSALYKGVLLSTNSQPGWRDARWLGGYLANSAILLGCAALLALAALMGQDSAAAVLRPAMELLLVLNAITLCLVFADLRTTLVQIYACAQLWQIGILAVGVGTVLPLCLLLLGGSPLFLIAAVLFLLAGSLAIRSVIIKIPHALTGHERLAG